jgi:uncharacterized protein
MAATKIWTRVDYEKDGKQIGWLNLPHSVNRSAYGNIAIPITVIKNGKGPTVLLMAGTHGDEYEGQIGLCKLVQRLQPSDIQGRVIIMTACNLPAALASARVSPIDEGNLNRAFPGDPDSTPTFAIAHYIDTVLFPMVQYIHDLHSGGSSLQYLPFASARYGQDEALNKRAVDALKAFNPPLGFIWKHSPDQRLGIARAVSRGIVALGGEFGGGGAVDIKGVRIVERGLDNLLAHIGITDKAKTHKIETPTRLVELAGRDYYVYTEEAGLFEPAVELGDWIKKDQVAGWTHFIDNPGRKPIPSHFHMDGQVVCRRHFGRVERGDCVFHLATDFKG